MAALKDIENYLHKKGHNVMVIQGGYVWSEQFGTDKPDIKRCFVDAYNDIDKTYYQYVLKIIITGHPEQRNVRWLYEITGKPIPMGPNPPVKR